MRATNTRYGGLNQGRTNRADQGREHGEAGQAIEGRANTVDSWLTLKSVTFFDDYVVFVVFHLLGMEIRDNGR